MSSLKNLGKSLFLVSRAHHNLADQIFGQVGLFRGQAPVLFELGRQENLTQSELAKRLELTQASMTNILHRMEKADLVTRERDSGDGRYTRVSLTPHGRDILSQAVDLAEKMDTISFSGFSNEEKETIETFLERIHHNMVR